MVRYQVLRMRGIVKSLCCVSVVIPVYNVEPYVEKCIASVLRQTLRDFEMILVDDCGTDHSMSVIKQLLEREFPNGIPNWVRILHNPRNMGLGPSRNSGLNVASGEYIAFVDSDDYLAENYLETLYQAAKKANADVALCGYREVEPNGKLIRAVKRDCVNIEIERYRRLSVWARLYRRDFLVQHQAGFLNVFLEDSVFNLSIAGYVERTVIIPEMGYYYVQRSDSIMRQGDCASRIKRMPLCEYSRVLSEAGKNGMRPESHTYLEYIIVKAYAAMLFDFLRHCTKEHSDYYASIVSECLDTAAPQCYKNPYLPITALPALPITARVGTYLFAKAYQHHCLSRFVWLITRF